MMEAGVEGKLTLGFTLTKRSPLLPLPALSLIYPPSNALLGSAGEPQNWHAAVLEHRYSHCS
jgi:hypothetical protein